MKCNHPVFIRKEAYPNGGVYVPCGKCLNCLQNKRAVWTFRILQELEVAESARFVTLTYDEKHIKYANQYGEGEKMVVKMDRLWKLPEHIQGS